ncbi:MAG: hypothetical protein ACHQIM_16465 [Sphingobacteriales bacterium]
MERLSFEIFKPEEDKFRLTPNLTMAILWLVPALLLWAIKGDNSGPPNDFVKIYFVCVFLLTMYYLTSSFFSYKPLRGSIDGEIEFENDGIIIDDKTFKLADIIAIDFSFTDYYGQSSMYVRDFNPRLSQGVGNYVSFTDSKNQNQIIYFRFQGKHGYQSLSPFINEAIKLKKMEFNRGVDLLGIESITA